MSSGAALVLVGALVWAQLVEGNADADEVIAALNAAIDEARWKLEFYCTCRFRAAWGNSEQEAKANLQNASVVEGVMARMGNLFRASGRSKGGGNWPDNFECVESGTLQLSWYGSGSGRSLEREPVRIARTPRLQSGLERLLYSCPTFHVDPLNEGGWRTGRVLDLPEPTEGAAMRVTKTVERPDQNHLIVKTEVYRNDRLTWRHTATFSTSYKPPALVRSELLTDRPDAGSGPATKNSVLQAEGFVEVKGGWLPSRIVSTGGPYVPQGEPPQWLAAEWISDDLGKRPPTPEDFVITIPERVQVRGLKGDYSVGRVRRLDINTLTLEDLEAPKTDVLPTLVTPRPAGSKLLRLFLSAMGVFLLAVVAALIWRARRRRKAG